MRREKPRILLVEDNRVHREVACTVLENHGFDVVQARHGEEALMLLSQQPVQLVLMDIEMPWMNGIAAARKMRALMEAGTIPTIPIIALTADMREQTHSHCREAGMSDVIPKHIWKPKWDALIMQHLQDWMP